jgi:crotonobetainyl-CoA:carnitine CoA-transferase CaiB-like acyl-CoA transferase
MRLRAATMGGAHADGFSALGVGTALLLGIYVRERGLGARHVTTSMLLTTAHAVADGIVDWDGRPPQPVADHELFGLNALYRLYEASSGWVVLAAPMEKEWLALASGLADFTTLGSDPRFATPEDRRANDAALADELARVLRTRTAQEWEDYFLPLDVACVSVSDQPTYECIYNDEFGRASGYVVDVTHPLFGEHPRSAPLVEFSRSRTRAGIGCLLGEQTDSILAELGRAPEEIAQLREAGVVS